MAPPKDSPPPKDSLEGWHPAPKDGIPRTETSKDSTPLTITKRAVRILLECFLVQIYVRKTFYSLPAFLRHLTQLHLCHWVLLGEVF